MTQKSLLDTFTYLLTAVPSWVRFACASTMDDLYQELRARLKDVRQDILKESRGPAREHVLSALLKVEDRCWTELQRLQEGIKLIMSKIRCSVN